MRKPKLVMIGNGMAGVRTLEELLKLAPDRYDITVFGAEPWPNYNRIMLSPVLAGEQEFKDIILNDSQWYADNGITLHTGKMVTTIDRVRRLVRTEDGAEAEYDRLLLATGSHPFILPIPGNDLEGVIAYRDIRDTETMIEAAAKYHRAVVIGGGLLGLEAANGLKKRGMDVCVVHLLSMLMERQLDRTAAKMLEKSLADRGIHFLMERSTAEILGNNGRVCGVRFKDGSETPADLVVMAIGIRPNSDLAEQSGIYCHRGIVVNDTMQTYDPRIYAVGECVNHRGVVYGLVAPLYEQARVCANHLAQFGTSRYTGSIVSTKLKVTGIDLFSAGNFQGGPDCDDIILADPSAGVYKRIVIQDEKVVGAVMYGDTANGSWYFKLLREGTNIATIRDSLMFGELNVGDAGHQGKNKVAALADSDEVCGCNGVCKGTIVKAIQDHKLYTLDAVRKHTKASSSCGSCTGLVEQILLNTLGSDYSLTPSKQSMCGCTDRSHAEVQAAIREQHLLTIADAQRFLEWRTPNGCASCRPALNYYLISTWPGEANDDPQSRFINERAHANIQKDGTYSVVPRMLGGVTTPAQLKRIAEVAEKYEVPTVKVTGGQRIDLLGVKKESLIGIWRDLDMPSGHAYGKSLRTVKTCVGSEHCRFGTQASMGMGIELERHLVGMWSPHKVKLAVSGCPRNCAESGIKDVGVIGVESGWEIYVGGNGGIKTEVAQFLVKVASDAEVLEWTKAFLQLYREEGHYLERTVHYLQRVGFDHVQQTLASAERRQELAARLDYAVSLEQDPWEERVKEGVAAYEFTPLHV